MRTPVNVPGPTPAAMPSRSAKRMSASPSTASIKGKICSAWPRAISSPRSIVPRSVQSATLKNSVEVSMASTRMLACGGARRALAPQAMRQKRRARSAVLDARARRQCPQEHAPVGLRGQTWIAQHDHAEIVEIADQASDALLQGEHGLRQLVLQKGVSAEPADALE